MKEHHMPNNDEHLEELPSSPLTDEDQYFHERSYKELVESIPRIEEVVKFLVGATAPTSGLFLAAIKLARGDNTVSELFWFVTFSCWSLSIRELILVLLPSHYETGRAEPASWRDAFVQARHWKYHWLMTDAVFFIVGLLSARYPLTR